jgi:uroporphyrinogen decarboxylase
LDSRERIDRILHLEEPDRIGTWCALWTDTIDKWGISSYWDFQKKNSEIYLFQPMHTVHRQPSAYYSTGYDEIIIQKTNEWCIIRDQYGVKGKYWMKKQGVPQIIEAPVKTLDDFKEKIEVFMDPDDPRRETSDRFPFKKDLKEAVSNYQQDFYVTSWIVGPFEICRHLVGGIPQILTIMIKDPHFASYMFNSIAKYQSRISEAHIEAGVDALFLGEDLGYKNGSFFSPKTYWEQLAPAHKKIIRPFSKLEMPCLIHCDGNVKNLVPYFIKVGITGLNPLEVKAEMDVIELKEKYGDQLTFIGGIDVRTLALDKEKIKNEVIEKIKKIGQGGGFIVGPDHAIPPNVSFDNYNYYYQLVMKQGRYS